MRFGQRTMKKPDTLNGETIHSINKAQQFWDKIKEIEVDRTCIQQVEDILDIKNSDIKKLQKITNDIFHEIQFTAEMENDKNFFFRTYG